jgi:hypothetical protein
VDRVRNLATVSVRANALLKALATREETSPSSTGSRRRRGALQASLDAQASVAARLAGDTVRARPAFARVTTMGQRARASIAHG